MAIDLTQTSTKLITLSEAAKILGVCRTTLDRYVSSGVDGRKLETVKVGHVRKTTRDALQRFVTDEPEPAIAGSGRRRSEGQDPYGLSE